MIFVYFSDLFNSLLLYFFFGVRFFKSIYFFLFISLFVERKYFSWHAIFFHGFLFLLPHLFVCLNVINCLFAETNQNQQSILKQEKFLNTLMDRLNTEEDVVLKELEEVM